MNEPVEEHEDVDPLYLEDWDLDDEDEPDLTVIEGGPIPPSPDNDDAALPEIPQSHRVELKRGSERALVQQAFNQAGALEKQVQDIMLELAQLMCADNGVPFVVGEDRCQFTVDPKTHQLFIEVTTGALLPK